MGGSALGAVRPLGLVHRLPYPDNPMDAPVDAAAVLAFPVTECTCDEQWPDSIDGACPEHGLEALLADLTYEGDPN